jgi:hypothetical protein
MPRRLAESALLIASTVLSNDSNSHRQFASIAPEPLDFEGSVVGPLALAKTVFYMPRRRTESALLIASTVLSNDSNSHRQFASIAPEPLDFEGSVVGPLALAKTVFYMPRRRTESALLIASTLLSND